MTYGHAANLINKCDEDDIAILIETGINGISTKFPIDNFALFKEATGHDPDEEYPFSIE
jgi:hypothetical protein